MTIYGHFIRDPELFDKCDRIPSIGIPLCSGMFSSCWSSIFNWTEITAPVIYEEQHTQKKRIQSNKHNCLVQKYLCRNLVFSSLLTKFID